MCNFKKVLAMVLAVVMMLSVAVVAFADGYWDENDNYHEFNGPYVTSPTKGDTTSYTHDNKYGGVTTETRKDGTKIAFKNQSADKTLSTPMVSDVSATKSGTIVTIAGVFDGLKKEKIIWNDPKDHSKGIKEIDGEGLETIEVQQIGTGSYGIGANDEAGNVIGLNVKSKAPLVTVSSRALSDSKIANIVIDADNVQINKNVTKGTKAKTIAFAFPQMTKSKQLVVKKGAFNGAKKVRIVVSPKMTSKELKKLKKRLKKQLGATAYKKVKIVRG